MTQEPQDADPGATAKCPYCGCGFTPSEPGQVYCWPFCEQQDAIDKKRRAEA